MPCLGHGVLIIITISTRWVHDLPLLITYSRSGTNWLRYVIELLSGRPTPGHERLHGGDDFVIDRAHEGYRVASEYQRIILVVRNYKESLVRHSIDEWKANKDGSHRLDVTSFLDDQSGRQPPAWFIENLRTYHEFTGDKLLLYYEDLMTEPETELRRLIEFLDLPRDGEEDLFANLDEHRRRSAPSGPSGLSPQSYQIQTLLPCLLFSLVAGYHD